MTRHSPARAHFHRVAAEQRDDSSPAAQNPNANAYELMLLTLAEDKRRLKDIQSVERKAEAKAAMLPKYLPWVDGALSNKNGGQDDVLMTVMVWSIDVGDFPLALRIAEYAIDHHMAMPDQYKRTTGCLIAEECADYALRLMADPPKDTDFVILKATLMTADMITADEDMPDEVRAKLYKAIGYASRACAIAAEENGDPGWPRTHAESALGYLKRALALHDKVGVKKDIERLETALKNSTIGALAGAGG